MTALEIVIEVRRSGGDVGFDSTGKLAVLRRDVVPPELISDLRSRVGDVRALLLEQQPVDHHRYVMWRNVVDRERSVCLSCGIPPTLHGAVALDDPLVVDDPNDAVLIEACSIVTAVAAAGGSV